MAKTGGEMKKTLSLTGVTVNAMALIAPGAFLWTTFQVQASQSNGSATTAFEMWTGLAAALVLAFLTAVSYSELANRYPQAGAGSSYYFAEAAFLDKARKAHYQWARLAKFIFGWISHLYYWIYPGIMVAFSATLVVYVLGLFNVNLNVPEQIVIAAAFAGINGYIAFRGISGSTMAAIVINVIQLISLVTFAILAIIFRLTHPSVAYEQSNAFAIVIPHNLTAVLFQSTIAILLLVGFESVTALGAEAKNPKRDIRRAVLLSLTIQGLFAYLFEYFAANFFIGNQLTGTVTDAAGKATKVTGYAAATASQAPIGDMMKVIGDTMLGGTGFTLTVILAGTVILALIGTTLACLNTAVRITYVMGRDKEMPNILGLLHGRFATPHWGVLVLALVSAAFGAYGVLSVDNLTQITLASNTGTFLVYGLTNLIALIAFAGTRDSSFFKHKLIPGLGFLANLAALGGVIYLSITAGGATQTDTVVALAIVVVWAVIGAAWFVVNTRRQGHAVLVEKEQPIRITTAV